MRGVRFPVVEPKSHGAAYRNPAFSRVDCFAEFIVGRRVAPTRWLAMTKIF